MLHGKLVVVVSGVCGVDAVVMVFNGCGGGDNEAPTVESTEPGSL